LLTFAELNKGLQAITAEVTDYSTKAFVEAMSNSGSWTPDPRS
jgi:hypothetical protein